jgi:hypothetical protein
MASFANYREYWNPMVFTAAMAGTPFDKVVDAETSFADEAASRDA